MTTIDELEAGARLLQERRQRLALMVTAVNNGIEELKGSALPQLRVAIDAAAGAWSRLEQLVREHPELFAKPRSLSMHGIEFGWKKGAGRLEIDNEDKTVALIRRHLPEQAGVLIATKEVPVKKALMQLQAAELAKIGARISGTGDGVFIKPADSQLDKLVKALLTAEAADATEAA